MKVRANKRPAKRRQILRKKGIREYPQRKPKASRWNKAGWRRL